MGRHAPSSARAFSSKASCQAEESLAHTPRMMPTTYGYASRTRAARWSSRTRSRSRAGSAASSTARAREPWESTRSTATSYRRRKRRSSCACRTLPTRPWCSSRDGFRRGHGSISTPSTMIRRSRGRRRACNRRRSPGGATAIRRIVSTSSSWVTGTRPRSRPSSRPTRKTSPTPSFRSRPTTSTATT